MYNFPLVAAKTRPAARAGRAHRDRPEVPQHGDGGCL